MSGEIRIKKWADYQHYKKRNPPWIKLHRDVLSQPWYRPLSDNAWRFLTELWILAAKDGGTVPYDTLMILRECKRTVADKPLLDAALEELASANAITVAGTDASADFLASLSPRGTEEQRYREAETVPTEPTASNGFHQRWAPKLRTYGVEESHIGDVLRNWLPHAIRAAGNEAEVETVLANECRRRQTSGHLPWNPAAAWNARNPEFAMRFRWALNDSRRSPERKRG